jgi:hypothetical protein
MNSFAALSFDIVLLAALAVAIFYCVRLSGHFNRMQADRRAFESLIQSLNLASAKAEAAIAKLKDTAVDAGETLQEKTGRARALSEELEIMIEVADSLANRLQALGERARQANVAPVSSAEVLESAPRTRAERELLEAVRMKQKTEA